MSRPRRESGSSRLEKFDRLLPLLSSRVARVAGAFDVQIVDCVPAAPHDIAVDSIVTESRLIAVRR